MKDLRIATVLLLLPTIGNCRPKNFQRLENMNSQGMTSRNREEK